MSAYEIDALITYSLLTLVVVGGGVAVLVHWSMEPKKRRRR